jgi:hypothetical protein
MEFTSPSLAQRKTLASAVNAEPASKAAARVNRRNDMKHFLPQEHDPILLGLLCAMKKQNQRARKKPLSCRRRGFDRGNR